MKKTILIILVIITLIIAILTIVFTYAVFESEISGDVMVDKATWRILINNTDISNGTNKEFVIDKINVVGSNHTQAGKIAPGDSGNFNILIDPENTDVSIRYDVSLDFSNLENTKLKVESIEETEAGKTLIKTGENTYTGTILLSEIKQGIKNNITVTLKWEQDETTDEEDTQIGSIENNKIQIPVNVKVTQYLGEEIQGI